jgi:hypothetical protein
MLVIDTENIALGVAVLSAVASIAAAIAAWGSWKTSQSSKDLATQAALASHHGLAAQALADALSRAWMQIEPLRALSKRIKTDLPRASEAHDTQEKGGSNPRPLRHVLDDTAELLCHHSVAGRRLSIAFDLYAVVRDSPLQQSDDEFFRLLKKADGKCSDFAAIFGGPDSGKPSFESPAFRWGLYQAIRRLASDGWMQIWQGGWTADGWIYEYRELHKALKPMLNSWSEILAKEEGRLAFSPFPLSTNASLHSAYDQARRIFGVLSEDCSLELMEIYKDTRYPSDACYLIIYVLAVMELIRLQMDRLYVLHMPSQA